MKHTKLPYKIIPNPNKKAFLGNLVITPNSIDESVCTVTSCDTEDETHANAEFIIKACNNHYDLVTFLSILVEKAKSERWIIMNDGIEVVSSSIRLLEELSKIPPTILTSKE